MVRNEKRILHLLFAFIIITLFSIVLLYLGGNEIENNEFSISFYDKKNNLEFNWWKNDEDGKYYLFLPGSIDTSNYKIKIYNSKYCFIDETYLFNGENVEKIFDGNCHIIRDDENNDYDLVVLIGSNIPAVSITTEKNGLEIIESNKNERRKGYFRFFNNGRVIESSLDYIKTRGKGTWVYDKKSYNIKLSEKNNVFNKKEKEYTLLADYDDPSAMKNKISLDLAKQMGIDDVSDSLVVDVYINNCYKGIYTLCEKHKTSEGVFLEYDFRRPYSDESISFISNHNKGIEIIKGADGREYSKEEIEQLYNEFENAVYLSADIEKIKTIILIS